MTMVTKSFNHSSFNQVIWVMNKQKCQYTKIFSVPITQPGFLCWFRHTLCSLRIFIRFLSLVGVWSVSGSWRAKVLDDELSASPFVLPEEERWCINIAVPWRATSYRNVQKKLHFFPFHAEKTLATYLFLLSICLTKYLEVRKQHYCAGYPKWYWARDDSVDFVHDKNTRIGILLNCF